MIKDAREIIKEGLRKPRVLERELNVGLKVTQWVAGIVVVPFEGDSKERMILAKQIERVCELHFSAWVRPGSRNHIPNGRFQEIL